MNILVTGAGGFIGGHLVGRLHGLGHKVKQMDKKWDTSTTDFELLEDIVGHYEIQLIVHLGANCSSQISLREPALDFNDNVVGTFNVCEVARRHKIPVIFNSTMKVYPGEDGIIPPYGLSKLTGENYLQMYNEVYGLDYIINRPSSVYGPGQNGSEDGGWFTWFIKASVEDKQITLFGDGTQSRDVLYIDDHIDLLVDQILYFDEYKNDSYDFGGGPENEVSLNELLDALDYHNVKTAPKLQGDVKRFVNDNKKVFGVAGWHPRVHWREGMERTLEWLKSS